MACDEDQDLFHVCPSSCYTGPEGTQGVGVCQSGTPTCDDDGNVVSCFDITPHPEQCNGVDDDCNGSVDENLVNSPESEDNFCLQCGRCLRTWEVCYNGFWKCEYTNPPEPERCDGMDNDCDCQTDEQEDLYPDGEIVFCYTGSAETVVTGDCRPGVKTCEGGQEVCGGEVLPSPERCDDRDNDCNGLVDDVSTFYESVDIILGIDTSGSMLPYITAVTNVVCDYARASSNSDGTYKFGLVLISTPEADFSLYQNMTDADTLCEALRDITYSGGIEPTIDAARAVVDPSNPLLIDWSPGSKRIFIGFGDEEAQVTPCNSLNLACGVEDSVTSSLAYCVESATDVYWFTNQSSFYMEQAGGCGGEVFWLTPSEPFMLQQLNTIIAGVCLEEEAASP